MDRYEQIKRRLAKAPKPPVIQEKRRKYIPGKKRKKVDFVGKSLERLIPKPKKTRHQRFLEITEKELMESEDIKKYI